MPILGLALSAAGFSVCKETGTEATSSGRQKREHPEPPRGARACGPAHNPLRGEKQAQGRVLRKTGLGGNLAAAHKACPRALPCEAVFLELRRARHHCRAWWPSQWLL